MHWVEQEDQPRPLHRFVQHTRAQPLDFWLTLAPLLQRWAHRAVFCLVRQPIVLFDCWVLCFPKWETRGLGPNTHIRVQTGFLGLQDDVGPLIVRYRSGLEVYVLL